MRSVTVKERDPNQERWKQRKVQKAGVIHTWAASEGRNVVKPRKSNTSREHRRRTGAAAPTLNNYTESECVN